MERKLFTHMVGGRADEVNNNLTHAGFRRSQTIAYRPACDECQACQSSRVVASQFRLSSSFRRILNKNADLGRTILTPSSSREQFDLLHRYLDHRHQTGGMADMSPLDYIAMVEETSVRTQIIEYRDSDDKLTACLIADQMRDGLSLVYSFFDPVAEKRSLGTFMILDQIARVQAAGLPHVYLGYLIENCSKMNYKKRFRPLQILHVDGWVNYA